MSKLVEYTEYGGHQSYGIKPIPTDKPGVLNHYQKDAYKDISQYKNRKVNFYDDKVRWNSVYEKETLKNIKESDYLKKVQASRVDINNYEYCHDENLNKLANETGEKNEELIRLRHAQSTQGSRRKMFSNWNSTYKYYTQEASKTQYLSKATIPEWFKNKPHEYSKGTHRTEHMMSMGIHGDNPKEKFSPSLRQLQTKGKLYSDNYDIAKGTSKASNFIPGYSGHIPLNDFNHNQTLINDPYFNNAKTNHILNISARIPHYSGYVPFNSVNQKGNPRPFCLTTNNETFS